MNNDEFTKDIKRSGMLAIREAFLRMEGEFDCVDIYNWIREDNSLIQVSIDNIDEALKQFSDKGECKIVQNRSNNIPAKYERIIEPLD